MNYQSERREMSAARVGAAVDYITEHPRCIGSQIRTAIGLDDKQWATTALRLAGHPEIRVETDARSVRRYTRGPKPAPLQAVASGWGYCMAGKLLT